MSENDEINAYPLQWPLGWDRAIVRMPARFSAKSKASGESTSVSSRRVTLAEGRKRLQTELRRVGARNVVISSNVKVTRDGLMRADAPERMDDPGVAVYFQLDGTMMVRACDKWLRVADNLVALSKDIEADRGKGRWGVGTRAQAFAGSKLLSAMEAKRSWYEVFGFKVPPPRALFEKRYIELMKKYHPDNQETGNASKASDVTEAYRIGSRAYGEAEADVREARD